MAVELPQYGLLLTDEVKSHFHLVLRMLSSDFADCKNLQQLAHIVPIRHPCFLMVVQRAKYGSLFTFRELSEVRLISLSVQVIHLQQ